MRQLLKRTGVKTKVLIVAFLSLVGLVAIPATAANASAYGCTGYGSGVSYQGYYVRNGTWCGAINGSSTYVNYVGGNFYTHVLPWDELCNFSMKADFYDVYGNWYTWRGGPVIYGCSWASNLPNIGVYSWMRSGSVRLTLMSNGGTVATVWESIY